MLLGDLRKNRRTPLSLPLGLEILSEKDFVGLLGGGIFLL